ncbi:transcriptional regulator GcvA [Pararobbsia alpina]|uniref:Glycine cleavage system transcriptional activator n=1 Tax=Pararobbsia alpina TaxID=621374 RepID=A0A6S7CFS0_9BURK|nr:transcriptional regulator GcvA [Pararobbsia alpina]CAB3788747.1 Glycine cleavage system transcriptional activator [Pararobbsia alpina]
MQAPLRRLPNLSALRAFEAAARHQSFARAAAELFVTHSAISHQIKGLENELGVSLFARVGRRVVLTELGSEYAEQINSAFVRIAQATQGLSKDVRERRLVLTTIPSFAARWLAPRIGRFMIAHPELDVELRSSTELVDLDQSEVDVAIRFGTGAYPGLHVENLMHETFFVVCSPSFNGGVQPTTPAELPSFPLLRSDNERWRIWLDAAGLRDAPEPARGPIYEDSSLLLEAAIGGQGIALVRSSLAADPLAAGRLVRLFANIVTPSPWSYFLVSSKAKVQRPAVRAFRDWVLAEAQAFTAGT